MKGIELSKAYFEQYGRPMLRAHFADKLDRIAAGLVGNGSECFGFDDALSQDHDFEPGFCLWIPREDFASFGKELATAYDALPTTFYGYTLQKSSLGATQKYGVFTIEDFYYALIGSSGVPQTNREWFYTPSYALATAVNGTVFCDAFGAFSAIRQKLIKGYPYDVKLKKLSAHLALAAQAGQYNYLRCIKHGERAGAQLALYEFVKNILQVLFLLENRYAPFYKWQFRALEELGRYGDIKGLLEQLLFSGDEMKNVQLIERICECIVAELRYKGLSASDQMYLECQAVELQRQIRDPDLQKYHLMETGD